MVLNRIRMCGAIAGIGTGSCPDRAWIYLVQAAPEDLLISVDEAESAMSSIRQRRTPTTDYAEIYARRFNEFNRLGRGMVQLQKATDGVLSGCQAHEGETV